MAEDGLIFLILWWNVIPKWALWAGIESKLGCGGQNFYVPG
jgi:hypothetical protein